MTSTAVRRLSEVGMADAGEVGGKAAGLGELIAVGARVPDGVVLTAAAAGMTLNEREPLLRAAADELGAGPFAVRSSGVVVTIDSAAGDRSAAPTPWPMRAKISVVPSGASPEASEAAVKILRPVRNVRRRPKASAIRPPISSRLPKTSV